MRSSGGSAGPRASLYAAMNRQTSSKLSAQTPSGARLLRVTEDDLIKAAGLLLDEETAHEIAAPYTDEVVFPRDLIIDDSGAGGFFPRWKGRVLVISHENQGVCTWGLSLDGPSMGTIVVGGNLADGDRTVIHTDGLAEFIATRRWDARCLSREPLLQAQAEPIDEESLRYLRRDFEEGLTTYGWPAPYNYRFNLDQLMIMLWAGYDQCDWWVSGPADDVRSQLSALRPLSNLATSFWSDDDLGSALLNPE